GKRVDSSTMISAVGTKKKRAAIAQMVSDEAPEFAAVAIQRGPRTVAILNNRTSQKPISFRRRDLTSLAVVTRSSGEVGQNDIRSGWKEEKLRGAVAPRIVG